MLTLVLPPLRERKEDIPILVDHFLAKLFPEGNQPRLGDGALAKLMEYSWPRNVRELENVLTQASLFATGDVLEADRIQLASGLRQPRPATGSPTTCTGSRCARRATGWSATS